jgi:hypothetical protein
MDEHAARVVEGVLVMIDRFVRGAASVADLQVSAEGAAAVLDNSNADLRRVLERLDNELELIRFTVSDAESVQAVREATRTLRQLTANSWLITVTTGCGFPASRVMMGRMRAAGLILAL